MRTAKAFVLLVVIALWISLSLPASASDTGEKYYIVHIRTMVMVEGNIGNDWKYNFTYNGTPFEDGSVIKVSDFAMHFKVTAIEDDDIPDIGTSDFYIRGEMPEKKSVTISVQENNGNIKTKGETVLSVRFDFAPYVEDVVEADEESRDIDPSYLAILGAICGAVATASVFLICKRRR